MVFKLSSHSLPETLQQRIFPRNDLDIISTTDGKGKFVLYLPTVVLRKEHNPAFALTCHVANACQVPVVVLAVVLDDAHLPTAQNKAVVSTARRIAFVLEALQDASQQWQQHGAGVAIRVHAPKCRVPHHLMLLRHATAVITDEPFVQPYRSYVDSVTKAANSVNVPFWSVDGSTTVPPVLKLKNKRRDAQGRLVFQDVPNKAWKWEAKTRSHRKAHVEGASQEAHLDAPALQYKMQSDFFLRDDNPLQNCFPLDWNDSATPSPGTRPWTVSELVNLSDLKQWVMEKCPGVDTTVLPCSQTHGSSKAAIERWNQFCHHHLEHYANRRNNVTQPHSVSRMSCYLNYGVVSIFRVVRDVWSLRSKGRGVAKFEDEIIKWREIGYAHAFANPDYNSASAIPRWALTWMKTKQKMAPTGSSSYSLKALEAGWTNDEKWNAMQQYLVATGELHNSARMTWGKTMLHWQKYDFQAESVLDQMVYVNDRYALDGLSPPSYAGLLWCFGWCDKPANKDGAISEKPAARYRTNARGFLQAQEALLSGPRGASNVVTPSASTKKQSISIYASALDLSAESPTKKQRSIDSYFKVVG